MKRFGGWLWLVQMFHARKSDVSRAERGLEFGGCKAGPPSGILVAVKNRAAIFVVVVLR